MTQDNHIIVLGGTGSGKTLSQVAAIHEEEACVVADPHKRSLAFNCMKHQPLGRKAVFDTLSNTDRVLAWRMLEPSSQSGLDGMVETDERIRAFADILIRRRGMTTLKRTPLIEEWTVAALEIWLKQNRDRPPPPLFLLPQVFLPASRVHKELVENCTDWEIAARFQMIERLSPVALRGEVGPAERILRSVFRSPSFMARCDGNFDFVPFLNSGGHIYLEGGGVSEDAMAIMLGAIVQRIIQEAKRGAFERPVRVVIDEALLVIGGYEAKAMAEMRKFNVNFTLISQSLPPDSEIREMLLMNAGRIEVFRCNSFETAKLCADILGTASLDANAVLRTRQQVRQFHDGYDDILTYSRDLETGAQRVNDAARARYRHEAEEVEQYKDYSTQIKEMQQKLLTLKVGERYIREGGRVFKQRVPLLREPYPWPSLVETRTNEAIRKSIGEHGTSVSLDFSMSTRALSRKSREKSDSPATRLAREGSRNSSDEES